MPWDAKTIGKHNKSLRGGGSKAGHTADIANAVLKSSGDEGMALAVANKWAKTHRAMGGNVGRDVMRQRENLAPPHSPMNDPDYEYYWNRQPEYDPPEDDTLLGPMRQARRQDGGYTPDPGAITPSAATMNPLMQGYIQRFGAMPTEQLQELAVRMGGSPAGQIASRVLMQKHMMAGSQPTQQSLGAAPAAAGTPTQRYTPQQGQQTQQPTMPPSYQPQGFAFGGPQTGISMSQAMPPWSRRWPNPSPTAGFLHSAIPGRTDKINASPAADSFVLPADVVSGLGEGNSLAGAHALKMALSTGPRGVAMPRGVRGIGMPRFKSTRGGATGSENVPIMAAGGEFVISPEEVAEIGGGDIRRGHKILEAFVVKVRKKVIAEMKGLKGPVKAR